MIMQIITNKIIVSVFFATLICQVWKVLHKMIWEKKFEPGIFFATGGMPSSHATFVTSLALSIGFIEGWLSTIFLLSLGLAMIVIRDAFGVRRTVDSLIKTVNEMIKQKKLEFNIINKIAGHTPVQVFFGIVLGVAVTISIHLLWIP